MPCVSSSMIVYISREDRGLQQRPSVHFAASNLFPLLAWKHVLVWCTHSGGRSRQFHIPMPFSDDEG